MDMMNFKPELQQQIRRDKYRVEQMNDFSNTWDHHYHQNIKIPNNLGLIGILQNHNPVPVQTDAYQHCTTTFMNNNSQGSSNWRSTDLSSQPSSTVNYGYDQAGIRPSINVGDVSSNHFSSRNQILDRPLYVGRDTIAQSSMTSRSEVSCLEDNQKGHVTVASSRTSYDQGSTSESYRGELMFLPRSLVNHSVVHNASQWNQGSLHTNKKDFSLSLSSDRPKLSPCGDSGNVAVSFNVPRNWGPLGPFTGYASILKSSRFLEPAQKMLEEFSVSYVSKIISSSESTSIGNDDSSGILSSTNHMVDGFSSSSKPLEANMRLKRAKLLFLQEEVCKWYKLYNHQLETVVSSFDSVAGLSSATPYISLAFRRVSRSFNALKTTISEELKQISSRYLIGGEDDRYQKQQRYMISNNVGFAESQQHHHWRPQRGLPEHAVTVLRAWLFDHFLHPYPTDTDKQMLATQTGLSRNQVSNWFINARVRLWKPMVEEIHMLETKAIKKADTNNMEQTNRLNIVSRPSCEQKLMNLPGTKRSRLEYDMDMMGFNRGLGNVSLTLGLRHGVDNLIQTETQDHQFGTGGQMFHDFVG